jgi:hypothetical protein
MTVRNQTADDYPKKRIMVGWQPTAVVGGRLAAVTGFVSGVSGWGR